MSPGLVGPRTIKLYKLDISSGREKISGGAGAIKHPKSGFEPQAHDVTRRWDWSIGLKIYANRAGYWPGPLRAFLGLGRNTTEIEDFR